MDRRFAALRVIGTIFKVAAWIVLILGLLAGVFALVAGFLLSGQFGLVGLDIGGPGPGEIAISIISEIQAIRYGKTGHKHMKR